ncbi:MAG: AMP-binding protein, partial [Jatrophihabitantaceae bacterium]
MIELLRRAPAAQTAIVTDDGEWTYGELVARAESVANALLQQGIGRFAVLDHDAATVVALLAGASLGGVEACQFPPSASDDSTELAGLAERFDERLLLCTHTRLTTKMDVLDPADLKGAEVTAPIDPPSMRPLLMLTTGTTGAPRGVRQDWNRVLRAVRRVQPAP